MEILAPAGSREALAAAVGCGADAVYLGVGDFNARRNAQNFGAEELESLSAYCHVRGVKLFLTLNTLLTQRELESAGEVIRLAAEAGVDALIIQDLAVWEWVRRCCPTLPLHASTQMAVHNLEGVKVLEAMGFERCILARELTGAEVAHIAAHSAMELEVFVHGALCFSLSGGCYLSGMVGERSGNRGLCAQPCRLPFACEQGGSSHCLSLKDMSHITLLPQLEAMGIAAAKIEGRMKRPEYVAAAVRACRFALGRQTDWPPDADTPQKTMEDHLQTLQAVFSRSGFTDGYWTGRRGSAMFGVRSREDVTAAQEVLGALAATYRREPQRIPVDFAFTLEPGQPARLEAKDGDGHRAVVQGDVPQPALHKATDEALVARALQKTGGTPYAVGTINCHIAPGLALAVSKVNALRAEALAGLDILRASGYAKAYNPVPPPRREAWEPRTRPPRIRVQYAMPDSLDWAEGLPPDVLDAADEIVLPAAVWAEHPALLAQCKDKTCIAALPPALFGEGMTEARRNLEGLKPMGMTRLLAGNLGAVVLGWELGLTLHGDWGLNILSTAALAIAADTLGLTDATLSIEAHSGSFDAMGRIHSCGAVVYGRLPLMTSRNCPLWAGGGQNCRDCPGGGVLTDRMGARFPVFCQNRRISQLYNSRVLYLGDKPQLFGGLDFCTFLFTDESPRRQEEILALYRAHAPGEALQSDYTRGLYLRRLK